MSEYGMEQQEIERNVQKKKNAFFMWNYYRLNGRPVYLG